jgi:hypothetical protein
MDKPLSTIRRDVVTPATTVLFVVSTVTGIMLLLHWQGGLVRASHEWLSLAFGAFAAWHLVKNWRAFLPYLRRNAAILTLAVSLVASAVFTALTGSTEAAGGGPRQVLQALSAATLERAAPAFGLEPAAAAQALQNAGFAAASPTETLEAIGARNAQPAMAVLGALAAARP